MLLHKNIKLLIYAFSTCIDIVESIYIIIVFQSKSLTDYCMDKITIEISILLTLKCVMYVVIFSPIRLLTL